MRIQNYWCLLFALLQTTKLQQQLQTNTLSNFSKKNDGQNILAEGQHGAISFCFCVAVQSFCVNEDRITFVTFDDQSLPMLDSQVVSHSPKALVALVT